MCISRLCCFACALQSLTRLPQSYCQLPRIERDPRKQPRLPSSDQCECVYLFIPHKTATVIFNVCCFSFLLLWYPFPDLACAGGRRRVVSGHSLLRHAWFSCYLNQPNVKRNKGMLSTRFYKGANNHLLSESTNCWLIFLFPSLKAAPGKPRCWHFRVGDRAGSRCRRQPWQCDRSVAWKLFGWVGWGTWLLDQYCVCL